MRRIAAPALIFAAIALVPLLPLGGERGLVLLLLARAMVFGLAALSLDVLLGLGGMVSFGHAAYLAIGAYAVAILDANAISEALIVVPVAMLASAAFATATGAVALRTRGVNFIMITLAFAQMVFFALGSLSAYGGDDGYTLYDRTEFLGRPLLKGLGHYYVCLGVLALAYLFCRLLAGSRFGRVLRAARQNEERVESLGYRVLAYRLAAMAIGAALCGLAGVLLVNGAEFASPSYGTWQRSGELLVMVILGGAGSLHGALLGAGAVVLLEEGLGRLTEHWRLIFGPLLVLSVLYFRGGLAGIWPAWIRGRK